MIKSATCLAAAMLFAASLGAPASASPAAGLSAPKLANGSLVQEAQYRRGRHHHRHHYRRHRGDRWVGPAIGAGIVGLIIGGSIAASRADYSDRWDRCAADYQSFRWSDGTFQPYDGPRQLCPYLRG